MIKRLTKKADCGYLLACFGDVCDFQSCDGCPNFHRAILRMGAYEDTGLEPEDIVKLIDKLSAAEECICKIEDALNRGADNDWAREAISEFEAALEAKKGGEGK